MILYTDCLQKEVKKDTAVVNQVFNKITCALVSARRGFL